MHYQNTYRGFENAENALKLVRSATALWDALGKDDAYVKGMSRNAILLFNQESFEDSIKINRRIVDFIGSPVTSFTEDQIGWAVLRIADCFKVLEEWEESLEWLDSTRIFGINSTHGGNTWYYSLKAHALYQLDRHEEAFGVAETALRQTKNEEANIYTARLYEIKAKVSLEQNRPDKERHLAHAISLLLAFGEDDKARAMSIYFKPDFTTQPTSSILGEQPVEKTSSFDEPSTFRLQTLNE